MQSPVRLRFDSAIPQNPRVAATTEQIQFCVSPERQIRQKTMPPAFATESAFLIAPEWACRVKFIISVRPDDARAQFAHDLENLAAFVGPDAGAQAIRRVVRALDRFFGRAERHHAQHRPENFLRCHTMRDSIPAQTEEFVSARRAIRDVELNPDHDRCAGHGAPIVRRRQVRH